jgi:uncharacterized membrane protein
MNPNRALRIGWGFVAVAIGVFGIQHLVLARFGTRVAPGLPAWFPAQASVARVLGAALIAASIGMVADRRRGWGIAVSLGIALIGSFFALHIPRVMAAPGDVIGWLGPLKCLTLAGAAFALAGTAGHLGRGSPPDGRFWALTDRRLLAGACGIMGLYLVYCGYLHLAGPVGVARLVPKWIPAPVFWAWFTGIALVLGGAGFWLPSVRGMAATLSSLMIFLWVPLLHVPGAITTGNANATTATFEALAFSGLALIIAASERLTAKRREH